MDEWISCKEKLPEREIPVLVYYPKWDNLISNRGTVVAELQYDGLTWDICGEFNPGLHEITHWMPLPNRPYEL